MRQVLASHALNVYLRGIGHQSKHGGVGYYRPLSLIEASQLETWRSCYSDNLAPSQASIPRRLI